MRVRVRMRGCACAVCVGEWVVLVRCVVWVWRGCGGAACGGVGGVRVWCGVVRCVVWVVWCVGVEVFFRGKTFLSKKNGFPPTPLSKETFTKLYPFLLLLYRSNRLYYFGKIIFD